MNKKGQSEYGNIVEQPRIYLISRPTLNMHAVKRFLADEATTWRRSVKSTESERIVELGGRICYMSFGDSQSPRTTREYIHNLIDQGHESVLEHAVWTVLITAVSRAFSHQLVRHRVGFSFSQLSQQYHDQTDAQFVLPEPLQHDGRAIEIWEAAIVSSKEAYTKLITEVERKIGSSDPSMSAKERRRALRSAARSVLPNATETKVLVTANARALRHFLDVRGAIIGDPEMRRVAALLLRLMQKEAPAMFDDFELKFRRDKSPMVIHSKTRLAPE